MNEEMRRVLDEMSEEDMRRVAKMLRQWALSQGMRHLSSQGDQFPQGSFDLSEPIRIEQQFDLDENLFSFTEEWPQQLELSFSSESEQPRKPQIAKPPGSKLMEFVRFLYAAKSIERIFDPIYADFCDEYFTALAAGEKWHARWIRVRYYKDFVKAVGLFGFVRLAKTVFEYWEKIA